jgi:hypothetical protein
VSPALRSWLARLVLIGGVAFVVSYVSKSAPHEQSIRVRLDGRALTRIQGVVTKWGDDEPTAGFSQDFPASAPAPRVVRHEFSAPNGTYIVVINCTERVDEEPASAGGGEDGARDSAAMNGARDRDGDRAPKASPKLIETTFERRVSLAGGEVLISPD